MMPCRDDGTASSLNQTDGKNKKETQQCSVYTKIGEKNGR